MTDSDIVDIVKSMHTNIEREKKRIISNFDSTLKGRYEVQNNKPTPYCQKEFHGESEKNSVFAPENLFLDQIWLL